MPNLWKNSELYMINIGKNNSNQEFGNGFVILSAEIKDKIKRVMLNLRS